jgi:hypothetical protein
VSVTGQGVCVLPDSPLMTGGTTPTPNPAPATPEIPFTSITPQLGVEIPGLELSPAIKSGETVSLPFLAQYINAAYRYMVAIVLIVSIVMVVYGGFRYLVGASMGDVKAGKKIIMDALGGMLIVLGAYMILNTINPETLNLKVLSLAFVKEDLEFLSDADYKAATGLPVPSSAEVSALITKVAREQGIDECALNAITIGESGGRANAIGYDSNAIRKGVYSRTVFIASGRRFSGSTFTIPGAIPQPTGTWTRPSDPDDHCKLNPPAPGSAQAAAILDGSLKNDARFDPAKPPNFGIDDRFSIGLGFGQVTLHPGGADCRLPRCQDTGLLGARIGGSDTCYSIPEILKPEVQILGVVGLVKEKQRGCLNNGPSASDPYLQARCLFYRYAGSGCSARVSVCNKTKLWAACKGMTSREQADCQGYWLRSGKTSDYCKDLTNN